MGKFRFQAKSASGQAVQGEVDAKSEAEARVILRSQQLIPIQVAPTLTVIRAAKPAPRVAGSVKTRDLQIFTRQFATLINSGIPVLQSLEILAQGNRDGYFKKSLIGVATDVGHGKRLADAMENYPGAFDKLYVNMVRAGEEGGVLDVVLNRLAVYIEKAAKIRGKVIGAMWYPAGVLVVASGVVAGILVFVIPKLKDMFTKAEQELPALTQWVLAASNGLIEHYPTILGSLFGSAFLLYQYIRTPGGKLTFDRIMIDFPLFGTLVQKSSVARFSRTLSTLLSSGVGIIEALEISAKTVGNSVIEAALIRASQSISEGKSITVPLAKEKYIPHMVVQMMGVGEQTGALDTMLSKIADFYEDEVDVAVDALTSVIEPLMMVFLGGIIAVLVIAMYLPIFKMASAVG